jgi:hypothetical protein
MIFSEPNHIAFIRNGLPTIEQCKPILIKTQSRRQNRGIYKVSKSYAVQRKRAVKSEGDIRIVMDRIWEEFNNISLHDAYAEGGYLPSEFEEVYSKLNPGNWASRWCFEFHVVKIVEEGDNVV